LEQRQFRSPIQEYPTPRVGDLIANGSFCRVSRRREQMRGGTDAGKSDFKNALLPLNVCISAGGGIPFEGQFYRRNRFKTPSVTPFARVCLLMRLAYAVCCPGAAGGAREIETRSQVAFCQTSSVCFGLSAFDTSRKPTANLYESRCILCASQARGTVCAPIKMSEAVDF